MNYFHDNQVNEFSAVLAAKQYRLFSHLSPWSNPLIS